MAVRKRFEPRNIKPIAVVWPNNWTNEQLAMFMDDRANSLMQTRGNDIKGPPIMRNISVQTEYHAYLTAARRLRDPSLMPPPAIQPEEPQQG